MQIPGALTRFQNRLRRTRPTFWHLRTIYVLLLTSAGCVVAITAANLVIIDATAIPEVEPIFFGILILLLFLVQLWLILLATPLRPLHTSTSRYEPSLALCVLHAILLVVPAYAFGAVLQDRVTSQYRLSDTLAWSQILTEFLFFRGPHADLAFAAFRTVLEPNQIPYKPGSQEIDFDILRATHGYNVRVSQGKEFVVFPSFFSPFRFRESSPSAQAADLIRERGVVEMQAAMDALQWCAAARILMRPLSDLAGAVPNPNRKLSAAIVDAFSTVGSRADSRAVLPDTASRLQKLSEMFFGDVTIGQLMSASKVVTTQGTPITIDPSGILEYVVPIPEKSKPAVVLRCTIKIGSDSFVLPAAIDPAKPDSFTAANDEFLSQVYQKLREHRTRVGDTDLSVLKVPALTLQQRALILPITNSLEGEVRQVWATVSLLKRIAYAHTGGGPSERSFGRSRGFFMDEREPFGSLWPTDLYWFGGLFPHFAVLYLLISMCFVILCWRAAADSQFRTAVLIAGTVCVALWSYFAGERPFQMAGLATVVVGGIGCCISALVSGKVSRARRTACLAAGIALPFVALLLFSEVVQRCHVSVVRTGGQPTCPYFDRAIEFWPFYTALCVIAFIATAEAFLFAWRRIVVKPNG